jgi:hypothetical protein
MASGTRIRRNFVTVVCLAALSAVVCAIFLLVPRLPARADDSHASGATQKADARDGQHDFDFEFGAWKAHLKRLLHPLSNSNEWVEADGTSVVRKIWDGRGNLGELEVGEGKAHIEGLTLRLYDPEAKQWSIYWASSRDGALGKAMVGGFKDGRGEFYDQEDLNGRAIFVRFIFSDITPASFRLEQAFSPDGAKTWETNWIATFTREAGKPR